MPTVPPRPRTLEELDTSHIPADSQFWAETFFNQRVWIEADFLLEDMPKQLRDWLDDEGIDELILPRSEPKYAIARRLKKRDVFEEAVAWRKSVMKEMALWQVKGLTAYVAKEIFWRLVEQRSTGFTPRATLRRSKVARKVSPMRKPSRVGGMEFLPEWMRWVALHPGLLFTESEVEKDEFLKRAVRLYLKKYACPHQAALNQFSLYRGDKRLLDSLFKDIARLHLASLKRLEVADTSVESSTEAESSEETKAISNLATLLGK